MRVQAKKIQHEILDMLAITELRKCCVLGLLTKVKSPLKSQNDETPKIVTVV